MATTVTDIADVDMTHQVSTRSADLVDDQLIGLLERLIAANSPERTETAYRATEREVSCILYSVTQRSARSITGVTVLHCYTSEKPPEEMHRMVKGPPLTQRSSRL